MKKTLLLFLFLVNILAIPLQAQSKLGAGDTIGIWYVINFDTTINYIHIDTSSQCLWQIGPPQKTFFNSAYSPSKAIITDTINNYPINNHSWFDLYVGNFNIPIGYPDDVFIDFRYKIDSDTLKDGGYISVSWDNGITWMNIIKDTVSYNYGIIPPGFFGGIWDSNLYQTSDTLYNGEYGFSGRSNGWIHTSFAWTHLVCKTFPPDTMIVRFNFISDNINNPKEGWMIDDIRLFSIDLGSGVHELYNSKGDMNIYPNPSSDYLTLKLSQNTKATIKIYNLLGEIKYTSIMSSPETTIDIADLAKGIYIVEVATEKNVMREKFIKQ